MPAHAVRPARHRDVEALVGLWRELVRHHARVDPHYALASGADGVWRERVSRLVSADDAAVFVCGGPERPSGFCCVELVRASPLLAEPGRAEIADLFVAPAARRVGAGRALVEAALGWTRASGIDRVEVRVAAANREGQAFWRALGWGDFVAVLERRL